MDSAISPQRPKDSAMSPKRRTDSAISPRRYADSAMSPRRRTDPAISPKRRTDSAISPRRRQDPARSPRRRADSAISPRRSTGAVSPAGAGCQADGAAGSDGHMEEGARVRPRKSKWDAEEPPCPFDLPDPGRFPAPPVQQGPKDCQCFHCGSFGHVARECPSMRRSAATTLGELPQIGQKVLQLRAPQIRCIIGKGGLTISALCRRTGAVIKVQHNIKDPEGAVVIRGLGVEKAETAIRELLCEKGCPLLDGAGGSAGAGPSGSVEPGNIEIPPELVKFFIGAKGANINEIKQKAEKDGGAVTVQVLPPVVPGGPQQVQVCGDNVSLARKLVLEKLEQVKQQVIDFQLANGIEVPDDLVCFILGDGGATLKDVKRAATSDGGQLSVKIKRGSGPGAPTLVQVFGSGREAARRLIVAKIRQVAQLKKEGGCSASSTSAGNAGQCNSYGVGCSGNGCGGLNNGCRAFGGNFGSSGNSLGGNFSGFGGHFGNHFGGDWDWNSDWGDWGGDWSSDWGSDWRCNWGWGPMAAGGPMAAMFYDGW